ncbi:hypothetical protein DH2020_029115 [Rehmannia glutinosa]|uniref:Uncharacterized protein n=1 Tax=Rehmannia glutinosa TaxID=99300 RepID=A0ABR0VQE8_REHGL
MDILNKKTKRASVSVGQSHAFDDEAKAKLKYQNFLKEYLELQKEYVSRKRKLQAAKQKKETILAEVRVEQFNLLVFRFLRRKRKHLSKSRVSKSDIESNISQWERNHSTFEAAPENHYQNLVSNSSVKTEEAEGNVQLHEENVRFTKKVKNRLVLDKRVGKRKICWPDQVTLKV